jgi:hypothetical protein
MTRGTRCGPAVTRGLLACLAIGSLAQAAFAGPVSQGGIPSRVPALVQAPRWGSLNTGPMMTLGGPIVVKDEAVTCGADTVSSCPHEARPEMFALPWGLRRSGAGVGLTILGASISIQRSGVTLSKSMTF